MKRLRGQVELFTAHARTLRLAARNFDAAALLQEANNLLQALMDARGDFQNLDALVGSLSRRLPSRPPAGGGMTPAAKWGPELRAGAKQFAIAAHNAESEIRQLYAAAENEINSPTRTATGAPDNLVEVIATLADVITRLIDYFRRSRH